MQIVQCISPILQCYSFDFEGTTLTNGEFTQTVFSDAGMATNLRYAQNNKNALHCGIKFLFVSTATADHVEFFTSFSNSFICKSER